MPERGGLLKLLPAGQLGFPRMQSVSVEVQDGPYPIRRQINACSYQPQQKRQNRRRAHDREKLKHDGAIGIKGKVGFITGANRGLGRAYARALLDAGAAKVYAVARDTSTVSQAGVTAIRLDVTDPANVVAAAAIARDADQSLPHPHREPRADRQQSS